MEYLVLQTNGTFKKFNSKNEIQEYAFKDGRGLIQEIISVPENSKLKFEYINQFNIGE